MRMTGSINVTAFGARSTIETSKSQEIKHLSEPHNPKDHFLKLIKHQKSFLDYIETRHEKLKALTSSNAPSGRGPRGAKDATFRKYRWYSEYLVILDSINAFETFYKNSLINLGDILQDFVVPEEMKDRKIDARILWSITEKLSVSSLIFEQALFHDLDSIDECTQMLVRDKRYKQNANPCPLRDRVKSLRIIFQVRHTLSHNNGLVTDSDAAKFRRIGYSVTAKEVIDPHKNHFGLAILRELEIEAKEFTQWLRQATKNFLVDCATNRGFSVPNAKRAKLEESFGADNCWSSVPWV